MSKELDQNGHPSATIANMPFLSRMLKQKFFLVNEHTAEVAGNSFHTNKITLQRAATFAPHCIDLHRQSIKLVPSPNRKAMKGNGRRGSKAPTNKQNKNKLHGF
jgi:hypothetical protein